MAGARDRNGLRWSRQLDITLAVIITLGALGLLLYGFVARWGFDWEYIVNSLPEYLEAAQVTLVFTIVSYILGMGIGFTVGWARSTRSQPLRKVVRDHRLLQDSRGGPGRKRNSLPVGPVLWHGFKYALRRVADGYVAVIRGTPLLVQIIFAWSILVVNYPSLEPRVIAIVAGLAALTFNTGAYQSEIFRAGIQTVHAGQVEAARAIGLARWGAMRHVVLPQAFRMVIPPLTNEFVGLLKASSFLIIIGIIELTAFARSQAFFTGRVFEAFAITAAIYLAITVPISKAVELVEHRFGIPGLGLRHKEPVGGREGGPILGPKPTGRSRT